jgi:DNA-binding transcriptional regulator LsrR (DeoR family)
VASRRDLHLMARVARLYYNDRLRQPQIAAQLSLSQARVSRLLRAAQREGIVQITVTTPPGFHADLEEALARRYGLKLAVVADAPDDEERMLPDLGAAAAYYFETTLRSDDVIGLSSWSVSLLATVDAMRPIRRLTGVQVVQVLGGVGNPGARVHADRLTQRFAELVDGTVVPLAAPGIAGSADSARAIREDPFVARSLDLFDRLTIALVGIGSVEPSRLLESSGNVFAPDELEDLRDAGAVGDICLRFFDADGFPVLVPHEDRVIGIGLDSLRRASRSVAVAGGERKLPAIRAALKGHHLNTIITDRHTAARLLD